MLTYLRFVIQRSDKKIRVRNFLIFPNIDIFWLDNESKEILWVINYLFFFRLFIIHLKKLHTDQTNYFNQMASI